MTIRSRLLLLFGGFGVVPLVVAGAYNALRSQRNVEELLARQTGAINVRAAEELRALLDVQESDLALLMRNADTERWLMAVVTGRPDSAARERAEAFVRDAVAFFEGAYPFVRITPVGGQDRIVLGDAVDTLLMQRRSIEAQDGTSVGSIDYVLALPTRLATTALGAPFGTRGANFVYDRDRDTVVFATAGTPGLNRGIAAALRARRQALVREDGAFGYREGSDQRIASVASFESPPWTLVTTASLEEFAGPLLAGRGAGLAIQLGIILLIALAFAVLLGRVTRPLMALTTAADRVAGGDLDPRLPAADDDEVGRLSSAFRFMLARVREMIAQVETSRQMAVIGKFAAQLAHEIRNPLTAMKINLQGLERDAEAGRLPDEAKQSVAIALREVRRLDGVVAGTLRMARAPSPATTFSLRDELSSLVDLMAAQGAAQGVCLELSNDATADRLAGDREGLRGALVNVVRNAIEAQPDGGSIRVHARDASLAGQPAVEVEVCDDGPGLAPDVTERALQPFFTTKHEGTGLGLSLAARAIQAQGGALRLANRAGGGASVTMVIPLEPPSTA